MFRRKSLVLILGLIFVLGFFLVGFIRQQYVLPILMYHSVNPDALPENRLAVTVKTFEKQMSFLKKYHYNVLPLEEVTNLIKQGKKIPNKTLAITFDDGYKDNYIYAFPILKKYNLKATIFVIINEIDRSDRLSWDEIKAMQDSGLINFGSHSLGPKPLTDIESEGELRKQIFDSKKILEEKLKKEVIAFSYPEGRFNPKIRQMVIDAGYKLALVTSPGRKFRNDDAFTLKRLRISSESDNLFVFWFKTLGFYTFIKEHRDGD